MAGSTNFKTFNANKINLMSDSNYLNSDWRLNGNKAGIAPADVYNKLFYQTSIMTAAYATALAAVGSGQVVDDSDFSALVDQIAQQMISPSAYNVLKFGNGTMIQTKQVSAYTSGAYYGIFVATWDVPFYDAAYTTQITAQIKNIYGPQVVSEIINLKSTTATTAWICNPDHSYSAVPTGDVIANFTAIGRWK